MPTGSRCVEFNTLLVTPPPVVLTTGTLWHGVEYLEKGAQMVRDIVAEKRKEEGGK